MENKDKSQMLEQIFKHGFKVNNVSEDMQVLISKWENAANAFNNAPEEIKTRLAPILAQAAAVIAVDLEMQVVQEPININKLKMLELKAKAIKKLQRPS